MSEELPYNEAVRQAIKLGRDNIGLWLFFIVATLFISKNICETNLVLERQMKQVTRESELIRELVKRIDQKQTSLSYAKNKESFFMERLLREKLHLVRVNNGH